MSDTAALDQKFQELNNTTNTEEPSYASKVISFVTQTLILCLAIIIYYGFSGALLYSCKLAQSNILPTEIKCEPYTEYKPTIQEKQTNIFTDRL